MKRAQPKTRRRHLTSGDEERSHRQWEPGEPILVTKPGKPLARLPTFGSPAGSDKRKEDSLSKKQVDSFWPSRTRADKWQAWIARICHELGLERDVPAFDDSDVGGLLGGGTREEYDRRQALPTRERVKEDAEKLKAWSIKLGIPLATSDLLTTVAKRFKNSAQGRKVRLEVEKLERRQAALDRHLAALEARSAKRDMRLLKAIKRDLPALEELRDETSDAEDLVYRFYHQSFKVYWAQDHVSRIVKALRKLMPGVELNAWFTQIVTEGTPGGFQPDHNDRWLEVTRPQLEAFFHARYFLEMACRFGRELQTPPQRMPSGWAALTYLWNMR